MLGKRVVFLSFVCLSMVNMLCVCIVLDVVCVCMN